MCNCIKLLIINILIPGGKISSVSLDAAVGTIALQWILFFLPSIAIVLQRPTKPSLAALRRKNLLHI